MLIKLKYKGKEEWLLIKSCARQIVKVHLQHMMHYGSSTLTSKVAAETSK